MPVVGGAIAAAAGFATVVGGVTVLTTTGLIIAGVINLVIAIGLSFAVAALSRKKPNRVNPDTTQKPREFQVKDPLATRELVVGELRKSGPVVMSFSNTADTQFIHFIIAVASHEVEAIDEVFLNDIPIYNDALDADGNVISGTYANHVLIRKGLGSDTQVADPFVIAANADFDVNFRLRGIAYIFIKLKFNQDIFQGVPNISCWIKGAKVPEIRDSGDPEVWSPNGALTLRWYLTLVKTRGGAGFTAAELNDTDVVTAANVCDQLQTTTSLSHSIQTVDTTNNLVTFSDSDTLRFQTGDRVDVTSTGTIPGGLGSNMFVIPVKRFRSVDDDLEIQFASTYDNALAGTAVSITSDGTGDRTVTKNAEPRYTINGVIDTAEKPGSVLEELVVAIGGAVVHVGDTWRIKAGTYISPTLTIVEDDLLDKFSTTSKQLRRDRFNAVKGIYASPINFGIFSDYPSVTSTTFQTEDNGDQLFFDLDLKYTTRAHTAQRLAKIVLQKHRQQITVKCTTHLKGMQFQPTDTLQLTRPLLGWTDKPFEVADWKFVAVNSPLDLEGAPTLGVEMTLRETVSTVYDWSNSEETFVDTAPNTELPSPFIVPPPTSVTLSTDTFVDNGGNLSARIKIRWNSFTNLFVVDGGKIEISFRRANLGIEFEPSFFVPGDVTEAYIPAVDFTGFYDVRVRTINTINAKSQFVIFTNYEVGTTVGPVSSLDYGDNLVTINQSRDYRWVSETVGDTLDFGVIG